MAYHCMISTSAQMFDQASKLLHCFPSHCAPDPRHKWYLHRAIAGSCNSGVVLLKCYINWVEQEAWAGVAIPFEGHPSLPSSVLTLRTDARSLLQAIGLCFEHNLLVVGGHTCALVDILGGTGELALANLPWWFTTKQICMMIGSPEG
eukprot:1161019-Pelagomonas_calceolata.AAC.2